MSRSLVWFRRDVRLSDNPAWAAGAQADEVCALFVVDPRLANVVSDRRRDLLVSGLADLDESLRELGGRLRVETGDPTEVVPGVTAETGAEVVHVNRDVTPFAKERDNSVGAKVDLNLHEGVWLAPPGSILTSQGTTYRVFSPFYEKWIERVAPPVARSDPRVLDDPGEGVSSTPQGEGGERAARRRLDAFLSRADGYDDHRDRPDLDETSRLSVDLKYGWLGPREVVDRVGRATAGRRSFVRQIAWRDFWAHVLHDRPDLIGAPMNEKFRSIEWKNDRDDFEAWTSGHTGYPLVDAGMRQLAAEGWLNNRVRMVVASFLVKDLLIDWRWGERHMRRHLVDGDTPQNVGNWQWVAGTGADAAPYFRVFNPVTQSQRYDPEGSYIRSWVPELGALPGEMIHSPWEFGPLELAEHGVVLGDTYPGPVVDHGEARELAIAAYEASRSRAGS